MLSWQFAVRSKCCSKQSNIQQISQRNFSKFPQLHHSLFQQPKKTSRITSTNHQTAHFNRGILGVFALWRKIVRPPKIIWLQKERPNICLNMSRLHIEQGDLDFALFRIENNALQRDPDWAAALYARATLLRTMGKFDEALEAFTDLIDIHPQYDEFYLDKSALLMGLGRPEDALKTLDALKSDITESKHGILIRAHRGASLFALGRYQEALDAYMEIEAVEPKINPYVFRGKKFVEKFLPFAIASVMKELGDITQALQYIDRGLALDPNNTVELVNRGVILISMGQYEQASHSIDRALQFDPNYAIAHYNKALTLEAVGKIDEALASYNRALTLDPAHGRTYFHKARVLQSLGKHQEALDCLNNLHRIESEQISALIPPDITEVPSGFTMQVKIKPQRYFTLAPTTVLDKKQFEKLQVLLAETLQCKAAALTQLGRIQEALSCLEEAAQYNPTNKQLLEQKRSLTTMLPTPEGTLKKQIQSAQ